MTYEERIERATVELADALMDTSIIDHLTIDMVKSVSRSFASRTIAAFLSDTVLYEPCTRCVGNKGWSDLNTYEWVECGLCAALGFVQVYPEKGADDEV